MALELRPPWCLSEATVSELIDFGEWITADGVAAVDHSGDHWKPGEAIHLARRVNLLVSPIELRQRLGILPGAVLGLAARWTCRTTFEGGAHVGGPRAVTLTSDTTLGLEIPPRLGGSIELETCIVVTWTSDDRPSDACPTGATVWSDGWSVDRRERTLLLEGAEMRIPVRSLAFSGHFKRPSGALWAVDLDPSIAMDDLLPNVVSVLLNSEILERTFRGEADEPDASRLPSFVTSAIQVDLVRALTAALVDQLEGDEDWRELDEGTAGALIVRYLTEAFGSVHEGIARFEGDEPTFTRELWHRFSPTTWAG